MKSEQISEFLQSRIDAKDFPSAVYLIGEKGKIVLQDALGFAVVEPEKIEAKLDTIYDLASLTKPLVTGLLCMKMIESGELNLSDKISTFFPEFDTHEKREITIENLLTHTSGFKAWLPFYLLKDFSSFDRTNFHEPIKEINDFILDKIIEISLEKPINSKVIYSDLNFLVAGFLAEKLNKSDLRELAIQKIFAPLGLIRTFLGRLHTIEKEIAASEYGNKYEKQMCRNLGFDVSNYNWRNYQIWSVIHDNNSYFMNGVSGHAGLFSTAEETFKIAQQFLANQTTLLKPETCKLFRTNFTEGLNEARSIAFQLAETKDSTAGKALAKDSFGHLGFTGTSLWIEPETERVFILLTNRTHARELPFANINSVRRRFHEMATEMLDKRT